MRTESKQIAGIDAKGQALRIQAEHRLLERIIEQLENPSEKQDVLCKLAQTYCELKKQDVAHEKNLVAAEKAGATKDGEKRGSPARPTSRSHDPSAPYGRRPDDTPYTEAEFQHSLGQAVSELYGLPAPDPATANRPKADDADETSRPSRVAPESAPRHEQRAGAKPERADQNRARKEAARRPGCPAPSRGAGQTGRQSKRRSTTKNPGLPS